VNRPIPRLHLLFLAAAVFSCNDSQETDVTVQDVVREAMSSLDWKSLQVEHVRPGLTFFWIAARETLKSCADFQYYIRRIAYSTVPNGAYHIIVTDQPVTARSIHLADVPRLEVVTLEISVPEGILIAASSPDAEIGSVVVQREAARAQPDSVLGELRRWARAVLVSTRTAEQEAS